MVGRRFRVVVARDVAQPLNIERDKQYFKKVMKFYLFLHFSLDGADRLVVDDLECGENDEPSMAVLSSEHRFAIERSCTFADFFVLSFLMIYFERLQSYHIKC